MIPKGDKCMMISNEIGRVLRVVSRNLVSLTLFTALSWTQSIQASEVASDNFIFQCVLEHRNRKGDYETTNSVIEKRFYFTGDGPSKGVLALDGYTANIGVEQGAIMLTVRALDSGNSSAVAKMPIERLQTILNTENEGERFVLTCENTDATLK